MSCHWRRESDDYSGRPRLGAVVGPVRAEGVGWYRGDDALISLHLSLSLSLSRMWGGSHDDDGGRPPPSPSPSRIRRPRKMTHSQSQLLHPPRGGNRPRGAGAARPSPLLPVEGGNKKRRPSPSLLLLLMLLLLTRAWVRSGTRTPRRRRMWRTRGGRPSC